MNDGYYMAMGNLVAGYSWRMCNGPPLQEHEFCLYQSLCAMLEVVAKDVAKHWAKEQEQEET